VAEVAELLGMPLMPWQQLVADVGLELLPGTLVPAYREVIVTVPRQSGKSSLVMAIEVQRALGWPEKQRIVYSAQDGSEARRKLLDDHVPMLRESPLNAAIDNVYRAAGHVSVIFKTGSRIDVIAGTEGSGHGRTVDLGVIDEAFDDFDNRREQTIIPAMSTRPSAQLLVISTAGHDGSAYLKRKVTDGRASVANGENTGIAYFEWSADEDADPLDPATWHSCMPALGYTITEEVIRHASTMPEGEFRRAYLNQWTVSKERVIPAALWNAACSDDVCPEGRLVVALDVNPERSAASICVADDSARVELVDQAAGVGWVVASVVEIAKQFDADVVLDSYGPAGSLAAEIEAEGITVHAYAAREMTAACGRFYDAVADGKVKIRRHVALDAAAAAARKRTVGDSWLWGRKDSAEDVSPLIAATLAFDKAQTSEGSDIWAMYA
jgi:hypothetical protein